MAPKSNDPNRIDVALEIVGQDAAGAIQALSDQVSILSSHLATMGSNTPEGRAAGSSTVAHKMVYTRGQQIRGAGAATSHPDMAPRSPDAPGVNASLPPEMQARDEALIREGNQPWYTRANQYLRNPRGFESDDGTRESVVQRELSVYAARERQQAQQRGGSGGGRHPSIGSGHRGGTPSSGASLPPRDPSMGDQTPTWLTNLRSNPEAYDRGREGFDIPQFGQFTVQNKLEMVSDFLQRSGERAAQTAYDQGIRGSALNDTGRLRGQTSGLLRQAADNAGQAYAALGHIRGAGDFMSSLNSAGVQSGFEQNIISAGPFGFVSPVSEAMGEGLKRKWNTERLRMKGGINKQQATDIIEGLAQQGFSGNENQNLAFDTLAPLTQQGQNPSILTAMLSQSVRNGAAPAKEFLRTMNHIGPAARAARMTLDEYTESLNGFANNMQGLGATYQQGLSLGKNLSTGLNLAPQQVAPLLNNPIVQGMALRQGFFPQTVGLMGSDQAATSIYGAVDMTWKATAGFQGHDIKDKATGVVTTAEDQRAAFAAQMMGITPDEYKKLRKGEARGQAAATAGAALTAYEAARAQAKKRAEHHHHTRVLVGAHPAGRGGMTKGHWEDRDRVTYDNSANSELKQLDDQMGGGAGWGLTSARLHDLVNTGGSEAERKKWGNEINKIAKMDPSKRISAAQKFIDQHSQQELDQGAGGPTVFVQFKGQAAKIFEQDMGNSSEAKTAHGAGGASVNSHKVGPRGAEYRPSEARIPLGR